MCDNKKKVSEEIIVKRKNIYQISSYKGHNFCVVNYGATNELEPSDILNLEEAIQNSKILVTTRMIKEQTALQALKSGKKHDCITLFNFAPALSDLNDDFNIYVDLLIVNEVEVYFIYFL